MYNKNSRRNLTVFWRQYFPEYQIPNGYHVHHIKPRSTFEDKEDPFMHHPKNLIALHPDDHVSIHLLRGDKYVHRNWIIKGSITKSNDIDVNGLNGHQRGSRKGANIRLNDIDENGLNSYQRHSRKKLKTLNENGLNCIEQIAKNRLDYNKKQWPELYNRTYFLENCFNDNGKFLRNKTMNDYNIKSTRLNGIKKFHNL